VYKEPVPVTTSGGFAPYFGTELRRHRERMGWKREELADRLPWSVWTITSVEQGRRKPPPGLGEHADILFGLPGVMTGLGKQAQDDNTHFGDLVDLQERAISIGLFDMRLVPGLLQTEAYARAVNQVPGRALPPNEIERLVQVRMRRQQIFERANPTRLHAVIDEAVLGRRIGNVQVMRDQFAKLTEPRSSVTVQVLPLSAGTHDSVGGPLTVMRLADEPDLAYADGWARGRLIDTPAEVFRAQQAFEQLTALALPPDMSAEMIQAYAEET
jgi:transcriptional regulator with XRE-family HTH domain